MFSTELFQLQAKHNQLMNQRINQAAERLPHDQLIQDKGAFFKSILGTMNHILVGDIIWLSRFSTQEKYKNTLTILDNLPKPKKLNDHLFNKLDTFGSDLELLNTCSKV